MLKLKVHGKWILAGEHSVLRGGNALVFPVASRYLEAVYQESDNPFSVEFKPSNKDLHIGFWGVLEWALEKLGKSRGDLTGHLLLKSNIPVGAGMGASATLCVALSKFFVHLNFLVESEVYEFAKSLEDLFHGKSSGVDVAVALANSPLLFEPPSQMKEVTREWTPHVYLSFSGRRAVTADCVRKVQELILKDPTLGKKIDAEMKSAVTEAQNALMVSDGIADLANAMDRAMWCFESWSLVSEELREHTEKLRTLGAKSVKPTGSGDGGFVLSLWESPPDLKTFPLELIPCF